MTLKGMLRKAYDWAGKTFALTDAEPWRQATGGGTYAGKTVTEITAMQTSAVWACVRVLAETIGSLPLAVYERDSAGNAQKVDHDVGAALITAPNADMTTVEYREAGMVNLALQGNAYSMIERSASGRLVSLYPIPAGNVTPLRNKDSGAIEYKVMERGRPQLYPVEKIWHWKGFGSNGLVGYSPIGYMRQAVGLALATEEFGARFFGEGATVSGFLKIPQFLKPEQRQQVRESLKGQAYGLGNAHKWFLLEGGIDFGAEATMPLEDAQYMLLRGFQVQDICRFYRIPPHLVGDLSRSTNNNIEWQGMEFVTLTLMPYLTRIEAAANKYLFNTAERARYFVRFNVDGLLRADSAARSSLYATLLQNGVMSRNEARAKENLNRSTDPGMDDYTVQSNMAFVQMLEQLTAQRGAGKQGATA